MALILIVCMAGCHIRRADFSGRPTSRPGDDLHLVPVRADRVEEIAWQGPAGRREVILRVEGKWYYAGMEAVDTQAVATYLSTLTQLTGEAPADRHSAVGLAFGEQIILRVDSASQPIVLTAYPLSDTGGFLIHATTRPADYFLSDSLGLYARIFTALRRFWPDGE